MEELWIAVALEEGHYVGIDSTFQSKEEAIEFAKTLGYVKSSQEDFLLDYGEFDYVSKNNPKYRLAFERIDLSKKYYGLYDLQLDGFKARMASDNKEQLEKEGADRAYELSQSDEEPIPKDWTTKQILDNYDYKVREVTLSEYIKIQDSDNIGLLSVVDLG